MCPGLFNVQAVFRILSHIIPILASDHGALCLRERRQGCRHPGRRHQQQTAQSTSWQTEHRYQLNHVGSVDFFCIFFWRARVCCVLATPLLMSPILYFFERCLDSNPESCRSKQALDLYRYQLSHPSLINNPSIMKPPISHTRLKQCSGQGFGSALI